MRKPHCTEQALLKRRDVIKGGAVVLASAFFPFSIEILNAGSAVAAPPAPSGTGGRAHPLELLQRQLRQPLRPAGARQRRRDHPRRDGQHRRRPLRYAAAPCLSARALHASAHLCRTAHPLSPAPSGQQRRRQIRTYQLGGSLQGDRTKAARHHRHLRQRGRLSQLRHGCPRQHHGQKLASGRHARGPAHESRGWLPEPLFGLLHLPDHGRYALFVRRELG